MGLRKSKKKGHLIDPAPPSLRGDPAHLKGLNARSEKYLNALGLSSTSTLQVNCWSRSKPHDDGRNVGDSALFVVGDGRGGEVVIGDSPQMQCCGWVLRFSGETRHYTLDFDGFRGSMVYFCHPLVATISEGERRLLRELGFGNAENALLPLKDQRADEQAVQLAGKFNGSEVTTEGDADRSLLEILDKLEFHSSKCVATGRHTTEGTRNFGLLLTGNEIGTPPRAGAATEVARALTLWRARTDPQHEQKPFTTIVVTYCRAPTAHRDAGVIGATRTRAIGNFSGGK